jgi:glycosyltransferase involved in cell wall biosynthesis
MAQTALANAAIFYEAEGYDTSKPKLMGRHAAGEGFLKAFVRHAQADELFCYARNRSNAKGFSRFCAENGARQRPVRWVAVDQLQRLAEPGTLFVPGPGLADFAWRRRRHGEAAFSLCGVTHTIASHGAMDALAGYLTAPVGPWDALVCTSKVVVQSVERLLGLEEQYLRERLGARSFARPTLALIPLGVDGDALAPNPAHRRAWRERLGIAADDVVFFFMGRLSFHAKAHPFPMYVALEQAARKSGKRLHLVQAGWFANDNVEAQFRGGAKRLCPSVNALFLDGRDPTVRSEAWQAADVFTSLADNIQETFGLTPIEAMATDLPCVVSDWNGYRDTVREGVDGFRIPTLMAPAPLGAGVAARHEDGIDSYDYYIGHASQAISVDVPRCAAAYARLASDPALRRRMGAAARERVRQEFDWRVIIPRYQELWAELGEKRRAAPKAAPPPPGRASPRRADPFWLFSGYPTSILRREHRLAAVPGADRARVEALQRLPFFEFASAALPAPELCALILERAGRAGGATVADVLAAAPSGRRQDVARAVVWLHKVDLLHVSQPAPGTSAAGKPKPRP